MKFISLGIIDKKFWIPVLGGIINLLYTIFIRYSPKYRIIYQNPLLVTIYTSLGMILSFIPFVIIKRKSKAANTKLFKSEYFMKLKDSKDAIKKTKFKKFRFIFYSTSFDFLETLLVTVFIKYSVYNLWIFDIIFMSLFSFLILKTKYYKHQFISMIVIVILGLGLNIVAFFKYDKTGVYLKSFNTFLQFITEICFCLWGIIMKYNMEKNYCNPYELCLWQGIFEFILHSICLIIFCRFELSVNGIQYPDILIKYFNDFNYNDLIICLSRIIKDFIFNISVILTCDYFAPIHILIIWIISETGYHLLPNSNWALNILSIFILVVITIMFLVFIEVIEINIFNISYNTKKNIKLRSIKDCLLEFDSGSFLVDEPNLDEKSE